MASRQHVFSTRIALRAFVTLALAAALPLAILILMVTTQVSGTLETQARQDLAETSRSLGQQLLDRLLLADATLEHLATDRESATIPHFLAAQLVVDGQAETILGTPFPIPALKDDANRAAITVGSGSGPRDILMSRRTENGVIVGLLDQAFLWDVANLLPFAANLCVLDSESRSFLFCSETLGDDAEAIVLSSTTATTGELSWSGSEGEILASHWELFLTSPFEAAPWSIVISQPRAVALETISAFNRIFPTVAGATLILTLLLAAGQIRHILHPLEQLVAGTRRFANRDFSERIKLAGRNEFSELAEAMNEMASSLDDEFETITALADIDRFILSSQSINEVLERILDRVVALSPKLCASILLIDPDNNDRGQLFSRLPRDAISTLHSRIELSNAARAWLGGVAAGGRPDPNWIREHIPELPQPAAIEATHAVAIPIFRAAELRGGLLIQLPEDVSLSDSEQARLAELASRLAVAVSASDHESELFQRAHFDPLTELPNRQLFLDRLYQAIAQARREAHQLALLFIDLDRFKNVNDTLGHALGDELLKETAFRLTTSVRETDTVARLGGDEFVIILPHVDGVIEVEQIVGKIHSVLTHPFRFSDQEFSISASIGITIFPDDATDAHGLLQKADTAMYAAKDQGRARIEFFEEEMDRSIRERLQMQHDLREAFKNGQFNLVYQPQLHIETGKLIGAEALLRWHHPRRGAISPMTFVPVLEEMGMIGTVGRWVLETSFANFTAWTEEGLCLPRIAVNISGKQLQEDDFEEFVLDRLEAHGMRGDQLEIELTEHSLVTDFDRANKVLTGLSDHGVRIAIDDFGTGYSSLGYLQGLKFDVLKVDRAFVQGLPSEKSIAIVDAILGVAKALGKTAVAEGIDSEQQRIKLLELGCELGQGYLLSLPIPSDEVVEWARRLDETSVIQKLIAKQSEEATG